MKKLLLLVLITAFLNSKADINPLSNTKELNLETLVTVNPDIFTKDVTIKLTQYVQEEIKVSLTDILGRRILSAKFENGSVSKTINMSQLAQGEYQLTVQYGSQSFSTKLVKE
jgi:hypothetical protein